MLISWIQNPVTTAMTDQGRPVVSMLDINNIVPPAPARPNYDKQVLEPLHADQVAEAHVASLAEEEAAQAQAQQEALEQAREVQPVQAPVSGTIQNIIVKWANYYGVSSEQLLRVAKCESTFNPSVVNPGYYAGGGNPTGLFQFLPDTFEANAVRVGLSNPDIWSADDSAHVAAYMFSIGQSGQWECK